DDAYRSSPASAQPVTGPSRALLSASDRAGPAKVAALGDRRLRDPRGRGADGSRPAAGELPRHGDAALRHGGEASRLQGVELLLGLGQWLGAVSGRLDVSR